MKKVAVIGTVGVPAKYGGFETLVETSSGSVVPKMWITLFLQRQGLSDPIENV